MSTAALTPAARERAVYALSIGEYHVRFRLLEGMGWDADSVSLVPRILPSVCGSVRLDEGADSNES
jgi:hypothetical protein